MAGWVNGILQQRQTVEGSIYFGRKGEPEQWHRRSIFAAVSWGMTRRQEHTVCNRCKPSPGLKSGGHEPTSDLQLHREVCEISLAGSLYYEDGVRMQRMRGPNKVGCQQNRKSVCFTTIKRRTGEVQAAFIPA